MKRIKITSFNVLTFLLFTLLLLRVNYYNIMVYAENEIYQNNNKITFDVISEWETGFEAQLVIQNTGKEVINGWEISFDFPYVINTIWDGKIKTHEGNHYVIKNVRYNNEINTNGSIKIGFNAKKVNGSKIIMPTNFNLISENEEIGDNNPGNQQDENNNSGNQQNENNNGDYKNIAVSYNITSKWDKNYNLEVTIQNNGKNKIDDWSLSFNCEDEIQTIWNAKIATSNSSYYIIKNDGWNQDILPGKKIKFGYTARYKDDIHFPENIEMNLVCKEIPKEDVSIKFVSLDSNNGKISITNNSKTIIEDWKLSIPDTIKIKTIWDAKISANANGFLFIDNMGYNGNINPQKTVEFGFTYTTMDINQDLIKLYHMELFNKNDFIFDSDNDGIYDKEEIEVYFTDPKMADTDKDGLSDYFEIFVTHTNPLKSNSYDNNIKDSKIDSDEDGLTNFQEYELGTDPLLDDSDEDGLLDGEETNKYKTNPIEFDTDNDELADGDEIILKLNPLIKDTGKTGFIDGNKVIKQTIKQHIEDGRGITSVNVMFKSKGNIYNSTYIDEVYDTSDISKSKAIVGSPLEIESTSKIEDNISITFYFDDSILNKIESKDLGIAKYIKETNEFFILSSKFDKDNKKISTTTSTFGEFCLINKKELSESEIKTNLIKLPKSRKTTKKITKKSLEKKLIKLVKKDQGKKYYVRTYTAEEALELIFKYDQPITSMANRLQMPKALIQGILLREITCIYIADDMADLAVMNYFTYEQNLDTYMKLPWYLKIGMIIEVPSPMRNDSSTGLGQIFAKTAINSNNYAIDKKYIVGNKYNYDDWSQRKTIWYKLKNDNEYNVGMVGLVLKTGAAEKKVDTKKLTANDTKIVLARYNGTAKATSKYGSLVYNYYKIFKQYN